MHQITRRATVADFLTSLLEDAFIDEPMDGFEHVDRSHGRVVIQHIQVVKNTGQVDVGTWKDCKRLGRVISMRAEGDKRRAIETRYYISSAELTHQQLHTAVRQHWAIENRLHWCLDVIFREDAANQSSTVNLVTI